MNTTTISAQDVQQVAKDLNIILSQKQINEILENHEGYYENYPTDNWTSIVEIQIYEIEDSKLCNFKVAQEEFFKKSRFNSYQGWNGDTTFNFFGNTWKLFTAKGSRGLVTTHCCIVQDSGNGMITMSMNLGQKDTKEDFKITHGEVARLTESIIKEYHLKAFDILKEKAINNEIECGLDAYKIEVGQIFFTTEPYNNRRAVTEILENGTRFKVVYLDASRISTDAHVSPYSKKFGIGVYYNEGDTIPMSEVIELMQQANINMEIQAKEEAEAQALARIEADKKQAYLSQFKQADKRTTSTLIKQHILDTYPSVSKVTIASDSFSGGDSIDLTYFAPAKINEIHDFMRSLAKGSFNGMEDMYEYSKDRAEVIVEGHILQSYKYAGAEFTECHDVRNTDVKQNSVQGSAEDVQIILNEEKRGVEIHFKGSMATKVKDSEEIRTSIKANGFRWSRPQKMWYAKQSDKTIAFANSFLTQN